MMDGGSVWARAAFVHTASKRGLLRAVFRCCATQPAVLCSVVLCARAGAQHGLPA
jgi:hypothetical protein